MSVVMPGARPEFSQVPPPRYAAPGMVLARTASRAVAGLRMSVITWLL